MKLLEVSIISLENKASIFSYFNGNLTNDGTWNHSYDAVGNKTSETNVSGETTTFEYNIGGELTKLIEPNGDVTTYKYDNGGRPTEETTKEGTTTYTYNQLGQLVSKQEPGQEPQNLTYDSMGRITQKTVFDRTFSYTYDKLSRLTSNSDELAGLFGYSYDKVGNFTQSTRPNNINSTYTYDKSNRLTKLSTVIATSSSVIANPAEGGGEAISSYSYAYDKNGNRTAVTTVIPETSGIQTNSYSYDSKGQMTYSEEQVNHDVYPHTKYSWYTYDNNGNRKSMEAMLSSSNQTKGLKKGITEIIQQVIAQDPDLDKPGIEDSIIQILEFLLTGQPKQKGNQDGLTKTVLSVVSGISFIYEYTYNTEDQLIKLYNPITDRTYNYFYDIKGNLTSKQDYYGSYSYSWDYKNRLIETKLPGKTIKYTYDSKDRRVSSVIATPPTAGKESQTISYQYDNWSVLKETHETPSGSYTIDYSYKDDDTPLSITYNPADGGTSTTYYYLTDGHGDI